MTAGKCCRYHHIKPTSKHILAMHSTKVNPKTFPTNFNWMESVLLFYFLVLYLLLCFMLNFFVLSTGKAAICVIRHWPQTYGKHDRKDSMPLHWSTHKSHTKLCLLVFEQLVCFIDCTLHWWCAFSWWPCKIYIFHMKCTWMVRKNAFDSDDLKNIWKIIWNWLLFIYSHHRMSHVAQLTFFYSLLWRQI